MKEIDKTHLSLLQHFNISQPEIVGKGGHVIVYGLSKNKVIKIFKSAPDHDLDALSHLQKQINSLKLPIKTPEIIEHGQQQNIHYIIETRLPGRPLSTLYQDLSQEQQKKSIREFINLINHLSQVTLPQHQYGQLLPDSDSITAKDWPTFLTHKARQQANKAGKKLLQDVPNYQQLLEVLATKSTALVSNAPKSLVHGDYFYDNLLFDNDANPVSLVDFGQDTVVGDSRMDVASGLVFLDLKPDFSPSGLQAAQNVFGQDIQTYINLYTCYYSFYWAPSYTYSPGLYQWCLNNFKDKSLWN